MSKEVVITGMGVVTSAGVGKQNFWDGVRSGRSFISPIARFDTHKFHSKVAGIIEDFDASVHLDPRIIAQTDRWTHFDLICVKQALNDSKLDLMQEDPSRVGLVFAVGTGGNEFGQKQLHLCWEKGPRAVSAYQSIAWFYAASIGQVSIRHGVRGYGRNICAEAAGGLIALAHAARIIDRGICDVIIVGGSEAPLAPYIFSCYQSASIVSSNTDQYPYRPFDRTRSGPIVGEGGAAFCLESKQHALRRNAPIYAQIAGFGQTFDGHFTQEPVADALEYARAIDNAVAQARLTPGDIDWILCDGLGSQQGDIAEVNALTHVFGDALPAIPASAPKSMFGRLYNGGSTVDTAMALLGMEHNMILPTVGYSSPDGRCAIDCVPNQPRAQHLEHVLIGARGFGGFNAALVLQRCG